MNNVKQIINFKKNKVYEFTDYEVEKLERIIQQLIFILNIIEKLETEVRFLRLKEEYNKLGEAYKILHKTLSNLQEIKSLFR